MTVYSNFFGGAFFGGGFFGGGTEPGGGGYHPSQGYTGYETRRRTRKQIREERERLGILPKEVKEVIRQVAERQARTQEQDLQKQYDELAGELKLLNLGLEARYFDYLTLERSLKVEALRVLQERQKKAILTLLLIAAAE